ncbi:MAG: anti-sigma factor [Gammaproteobacteria bacterium]|nr:anti-sigma factor [Gammaproteobacteria bacterium]
MAERLDDEMIVQAGEYVLGTLDGVEREAFEHVMQDNAALREAVAAWEQRLDGFNDATAPVQPPQRVWLAVENAIAPAPEDGADEPAGWWRSLALWRSVAAAAVLALLAVVLPPLLTPPTLPEQPPVYNLVLRAADQQPLWAVVCDWRSREYAVTRVAATDPAAGKAHELWLLPADDGAPMSLGLIDLDSISGTLPASADWHNTKAIAVSLEPAGGSPTGLPTGPVLHVAPVSG